MIYAHKTSFLLHIYSLHLHDVYERTNAAQEYFHLKMKVNADSLLSFVASLTDSAEHEQTLEILQQFILFFFSIKVYAPL